MKLTEYTKTEWRDGVRRLRPDITDEQFDAMWAEFVELKRRRGLQ